MQNTMQYESKPGYEKPSRWPNWLWDRIVALRRGRLRGRPWSRVDVPTQVATIPSMISHEERQYLIWLTETQAEGWGAIVDLGPWLGASSAALAEGVRRRGARTRIQSFDCFKWVRAYMESQAPLNLPDGVDFLQEFLRQVGDYRAWIEPHVQDLTSYRWSEGPIEILFVDAAKSWDLLNAILTGFGDALVPGRSRVVFQDFRYHMTHWLPLVTDSRPDVWAEVENVGSGSTVTFMPLKPLYGPGGLSPRYVEADFPLEKAEPLLRRRMAKEGAGYRNLYLRTLYRKCLIERPFEEARGIKVELLADRGLTLSDEELALIEDVSGLGWELIQRGDYAHAQRLATNSLARGCRSQNALAVLALAYLRQNQLEAAEVLFEELLDRYPHYAHGRLHRATLRIAQGRFDEAADDLERVSGVGQPDEATMRWCQRLQGALAEVRNPV